MPQVDNFVFKGERWNLLTTTITNQIPQYLTNGTNEAAAEHFATVISIKHFLNKLIAYGCCLYRSKCFRPETKCSGGTDTSAGYRSCFLNAHQQKPNLAKTIKHSKWCLLSKCRSRTMLYVHNSLLCTLIVQQTKLQYIQTSIITCW